MTIRNSSISLYLVFSFATFCSQLFASDLELLTQYRLNGIKKIEKKLDKELSSKSYWIHYLKNRDTTFGYIEYYKDILLCNKEKSTLLLYVKDANGNYILQKKYNALTGKIKGDKKREGDLRTPIGLYDLVKKVSKIDEFYGPLAYVTSYPNLYDRYRGKTGQGIWIHGLPTLEKRASFTKGCIAINNKCIHYLGANLDMNRTLLIIHSQSHYRKTSKTTLATLLSQLYAWRYAWKYNNLQNYLSFYDEKFLRYDGMTKERFRHYKKRVFSKNEEKSILFKELNIIPYPTGKNTFKVTFNELYSSKSVLFNGKKSLIVKLKQSKMKIITER